MLQHRPSYLGRLEGDWPPAVVALDRSHPYANFETLPPAAEEAVDDFIDACLSGDVGRFEPPPRVVAHA
jgi:hypothetical protein